MKEGKFCECREEKIHERRGNYKMEGEFCEFGEEKKCINCRGNREKENFAWEEKKCMKLEKL